MVPGSSRIRYANYRRRLRNEGATSPEARKQSTRRKTRSFGELFWEFLKLLRGHEVAIGFALTTLTLATVLTLLPPLATKLVIDHVLTDAPVSPAWSAWLPL